MTTTTGVPSTISFRYQCYYNDAKKKTLSTIKLLYICKLWERWTRSSRRLLQYSKTTKHIINIEQTFSNGCAGKRPFTQILRLIISLSSDNLILQLNICKIFIFYTRCQHKFELYTLNIILDHTYWSNSSWWFYFRSRLWFMHHLRPTYKYETIIKII